MKQARSFFFLLLGILSHTLYANTVEHKLIVSMHPLEPFVYIENGKVTSGFVADIYNQMASRLSHYQPVQVSSFARGLNILKQPPKRVMSPSGKVTFYHRAHLIVAKTTERLPAFKWVGPFLYDGSVLYKRSSDKREFKQLGDIRRHQATCVSQRKVADTEIYKKYQIPYHETDSQLEAIQLLLQPRSRFDCTIISLMNTREILASSGYSLDALTPMSIQLSPHGVYMAFSAQTPDTIVNKWQSALDELDSQGLRLTYIQKYVPFYTQELELMLRGALDNHSQ
ncbi:substrate-binding periplasmic protein [Pseudoalteromonas umbrosa]|uniref:substrate-binding periplasmic protein n=1 Tax=Pseudoalteromonas umbrosa TaxID=3048489 RepID=UPI0024C465FE|nr:transporter substrate-binding domain-containing protein [Pseudoalteromonas sp. B95]MDK1288813.1 transporter substrate-binding domain-containing protein [Pseudoalteromonas sp. B95]